MCGISGSISASGNAEDRTLILAMTQILAHRGPDGEGVVSDDGNQIHFSGLGLAPRTLHHPFNQGNGSRCWTATLGHRRLSIIDLSADGNQPMSDASGRYWIVYNGEVFNYIELRQELESLGHVFRSQTDTEVILAAFIQWGSESLSRFNGMWAFAIWDSTERSLFCARDRFGVKPLYYHWDGRRFLFASEIKGLLLDANVSRRLNDRAVLDFLLSGTVDHLPGETFFQDIKQLPAANYMTFKRGDLRMVRYWEIQPGQQKIQLNSDLVGRCRDLLLDAARLRLRSDVPVGGTISGGIDSATLTCLVDRFLATDTYNVFSAQFPSHEKDESAYVQDLMREGNHLRLHLVTPSHDELIDDLGRLMWHQDEPFGDTSIYAHYRLMRLANENGIKVILTGQGADEVFAGYWSYYRAYLGHLLATGQLKAMHAEMYRRTAITSEKSRSLLTSALYHASPPGLRSHLQTRALRRRSYWLAPTLARSERLDTFTTRRNGWSRFDWYLYESIQRWSVPHLLRHDDRNSMAFGVESRVPYLDYRLVELLFATADEAKISGGRMKTLLRLAGKGIIPASITSRNDKIGFFTPMADWLARSKAFVDDLLYSDFAQRNSYFDWRMVSKMPERLLAGDNSVASPMWWCLSLCLWHHVVVESAPTSAATSRPTTLISELASANVTTA